MNRLAQETSPYLQQHKNNPVDWFPWGEEALSRARSEDKPILLSIGYSACHWCHVMEHESFENEAIARQMNENFVCIKVDREERPDLDQIYQNVAQAMTRSGGWPLTVFLTPDLRPFFGGTYFPPDDRYGRPGFPRVLQALAEAYRNDRASVTDNADKLTEFISSLEKLPAAQGARPSISALRSAGEALLSQVDPEHGGLGGAPKFPNSMIFSFLWRVGSLTGSGMKKEATLLALEKMAKGGIYDQLGGGFHRYSVDASWSVPHFEKMLYDNGLLLKAYAEPLLTDDPLVTDEHRELFSAVLEETVGYLLREMRSPEGAFYAAQDADSEGEEGKFFVWDPADLSQHLTGEEARVFAVRYGVSPEGNFEHGKTVLFQASSVEEAARFASVGEARARELLASARAKLFAIRSRRIAPGLDDKVLASWNGLAISGLCWAAQALRVQGRPEAAGRALEAARAAFRFVRERMGRGDGRLWSTFQGGKPKLNGYLDDYAFLAMAALDLARVTESAGEVASCIQACEEWIDAIVRHFRDPAGQGYFFTSDDHETLIQRPKTIFDQAIPSGTALALGCMIALAEIDPAGRGARHASEAQAQLPGLFALIERNPYGCGELLCTALLHAAGPVVVSGPRSEELFRQAYVFRKAPAADALLVCHAQSCSLPQASVEEAAREVLARVSQRL